MLQWRQTFLCDMVRLVLRIKWLYTEFWFISIFNLKKLNIHNRLTYMTNKTQLYTWALLSLPLLSDFFLVSLQTILTWYIGLSKNSICCYHLWSKHISTKLVLSLPLVSQTGGDNCIRNGCYGLIFLAKIKRFYGWYGVAANNSHFFYPLPEGSIEAFLFKIFESIFMNDYVK